MNTTFNMVRLFVAGIVFVAFSNVLLAQIDVNDADLCDNGPGPCDPPANELLLGDDGATEENGIIFDEPAPQEAGQKQDNNINEHGVYSIKNDVQGVISLGAGSGGGGASDEGDDTGALINDLEEWDTERAPWTLNPPKDWYSGTGPGLGELPEMPGDFYGRSGDQWVYIETDCPGCGDLVAEYNALTDEIFILRKSRDTWKGYLDAARNAAARSDGRPSVVGDDLYEGEFFAGNTLWQVDHYETYARLVELKELAAMDLAVQIQRCERQCRGEGDTGGVLIPGSKLQSYFPLPFDWQGPYSTDCWYCEKLVVELNRLPGLARDRIIRIAELENLIVRATADVDIRDPNDPQPVEPEGGRTDAYLAELRDWNSRWRMRLAEATGEVRESYREEMEANQRDLEAITNQFHTVLGMLQDCEQLPQCTAVYLDPLVQLQQTLNILGFNGFNVGDAQNINSATGTPQVITPQQPTTNTPPPSTGTPPGSTPQTPASTPLSISTDGNFNFTHSVGPSPCPTDAGVARISSNNGNPLSISDVSVSGDIADVLDVSIEDNNTANPGIRARFNCGSSARRSYSGQVTATVTDTVTGESQTITIPASGQVN